MTSCTFSDQANFQKRLAAQTVKARNEINKYRCGKEQRERERERESVCRQSKPGIEAPRPNIDFIISRFYNIYAIFIVFVLVIFISHNRSPAANVLCQLMRY